MQIEQLQIKLNEEDLNDLLNRHLPANDKVRALSGRIEGERLVLSGRAAFFMNLKFEATLDLAHTAREVIVRLERLSPLNAISAMLKNKLLEKISSQIEFIQVDKLNDALRIDLNKAMVAGALTSDIIIHDLKIREKEVIIQLAGLLSFSENAL